MSSVIFNVAGVTKITNSTEATGPFNAALVVEGGIYAKEIYTRNGYVNTTLGFMTRPADVVTAVGTPVNIESANFDVGFFTIHTLSALSVYRITLKGIHTSDGTDNIKIQLKIATIVIKEIDVPQTVATAGSIWSYQAEFSFDDIGTSVNVYSVVQYTFEQTTKLEDIVTLDLIQHYIKELE